MQYAPMLDDIRGQVESTGNVLKLQNGTGYAVLQHAAELLRSCKGRVIITGMGASYFAAFPAAQSLEAQGVRVLLVESSELLHYGEGSWCADDVAILISRSGGSVEVLRLAEKLTLAGVLIVGITNIPGSALSKLAQETVLIGSHPDQLIAVQSYTGTVLTLLLLAAFRASAEAAASLTAACLRSLPALEQHIQRSLAESDKWEAFLTGARPLYLLGRGKTLAALHGGSLLMHETAKASAIPMSSGQFRHGPVEAVDTTFHALVLGTSEPTRSLDWKLAVDLQRMGGNILWMGPEEDKGMLSLMLSSQPKVDAMLQPIFDVIPLQVAAYRLAWWRGIIPGDFRFASEITQEEANFPLFEANR